jgi:putative tricarboxylic transport membrane protein
MKLKHGARLFLCCLASATALATISCDSCAQSSWRPDKPVEIVLPTAAGGINDVAARVMQKFMQDEKIVGTPVVVINKAGGNQVLAGVYMDQHARNPHYLLYSTPTIFTNELNGIAPQRYTDLTTIACLSVEHTVITVRNDSPMKNMRDLLDRLKADPDSIAIGLGARGGVNHMAVSQALKSGGFDPKKLKAVIFKTSGETLTALIGGHVQAVGSSVSAASAQVEAGNVRMLGIAAPRRMGGALANVPTMREQGLEVNVSNWRAVFAPKGLTAAQIAFWEEALAKTVASSDWKKLIEENNLVSDFLRSKECGKYLEGEYNATKVVMAALGLAK